MRSYQLTFEKSCPSQGTERGWSYIKTDAWCTLNLTKCSPMQALSCALSLKPPKTILNYFNKHCLRRDQAQQKRNCGPSTLQY